MTKQIKQKESQLKRENKIIQSCIQKQLTLCRKGQLNNTMNPPYIPPPRALVTVDDFPHKGNKSNTTNYFKNRYKDVNAASFSIKLDSSLGFTRGNVSNSNYSIYGSNQLCAILQNASSPIHFTSL
jgi:hypothetical protein